MKFWTLQPIRVIEILETKGEFVCDISKSEYCNEYEFIKAYNWMASKMDGHGILRPEKEINFPIWAWHTRNWKQKGPDFRCTGLGRRGERMVCIELEIPNFQVLLSDYNLWHFVLNDMWIDESRCEEEWEEMHNWYDMQPVEVQELLKRESWNRIFDLNPMYTEWREVGRDIQAVFWKLRKEMITKIYYFVAK